MSASRMTIAWDRGDQMGLLPPDSSFVYPEPIMTIAWEPLTTPTIFDYDPADMLVTPGAGEEVAAPPESGGSPPGKGGEPPAAGNPGMPQVHLAVRRSEKLFLKEGYFLDVQAAAPARVRAVLRAKVPGHKGRPRFVNLTKILTADIGTDPRKLTLHPSRAARRALGRIDGPVAATLVMVVRYGPGIEPVHLTKHVIITDG
jgi:hypothetical protein